MFFKVIWIIIYCNLLIYLKSGFKDAKCEFMNPGGSSKDRIALAMVRDAESGNHIHEDTEFVEPTSGNTGIGVAFNAALLGNNN